MSRRTAVNNITIILRKLEYVTLKREARQVIQVATSLQNQNSMKIAFSFHNIHIMILHTVIGSIPDSEVIIPAYCTDIA
jgi:hypothetical protein